MPKTKMLSLQCKGIVSGSVLYEVSASAKIRRHVVLDGSR